MFIGDDVSQASTTGGTYGDIDFGTGSTVVPASQQVAQLNSPAAALIRGRVRYGSTAGIGAALRVAGTSTVTIDRLELDVNIDGCGIATAAICSAVSVTINRVNLTGRFTPSTSADIFRLNGGTVDLLMLDCRAAMGSTSAYVVNVLAGWINKCVIRGSYTSGSELWKVASGISGASTSYVQIEAFAYGVGRIADVRSGMHVFKLLHPHFDTLTAAAFYTSGATFRVLGSCTSSGTFTLTQRAATESISVNGQGLGADLATMTPTEGDMVLDTSSRTGAAGMAIYHSGGTGNGWKNRYTGGTY